MMKEEKYGGLKREDLLKLRRGDVVRYQNSDENDGVEDSRYLIVSNVNVKRGLVEGTIARPLGVNAVSISNLERIGKAILKWK